MKLELGLEALYEMFYNSTPIILHGFWYFVLADDKGHMNRGKKLRWPFCKAENSCTESHIYLQMWLWVSLTCHSDASEPTALNGRAEKENSTAPQQRLQQIPHRCPRNYGRQLLYWNNRAGCEAATTNLAFYIQKLQWVRPSPTQQEMAFPWVTSMDLNCSFSQPKPTSIRHASAPEPVNKPYLPTCRGCFHHQVQSPKDSTRKKL